MKTTDKETQKIIRDSKKSTRKLRRIREEIQKIGVSPLEGVNKTASGAYKNESIRLS